MKYTCRLDGLQMHCTMTSERDLSAPVFCFSGMGPMTADAGGCKISGTGSYTEVVLPDLKAGQAHTVSLSFPDGFTPANRAWMPLGPYLRVEGELIPLPPTPAGVRAKPRPTPADFNGLKMIPQPTDFVAKKGDITISGLATDDPAFAAAQALAARHGLRDLITTKGTSLEIQTADLPEDAYEITISHEAVTVKASGYGARFNAAITLLTLLQTYDGALPCGTISDQPRFGWRGQHLDTARHFYSVGTILKLLDLMALLKLNRFHWHFADDEAFRIQINCFPELWKKTEMRGEGHLLPAIFSGEISAGGSYSKADVALIIAHAKALNIEVMPEIEIQAHTLAIARVFPEVRDPADNGAEKTVQGYTGNVLNPAMPKTWEVLNAVITEISAMFPFERIHLGCDELPADTWMGSPKAKALMAEHGLETTQDLQGWMAELVAKTVIENGKRPAAWEEAAQGSNGGIGNGAILFSWTGQGPGVAAARAGYDVVMTPAQHVYLDMAHSDDPDDWGASWAAFVPLEETINWNPVPEPDIAARIIGVQGAFWSEFTTEDAQIWPMLMPRMLGVASQAWQERPLTADQLNALANHYLSFLPNGFWQDTGA